MVKKSINIIAMAVLALVSFGCKPDQPGMVDGSYLDFRSTLDAGSLMSDGVSVHDVNLYAYTSGKLAGSFWLDKGAGKVSLMPDRDYNLYVFANACSAVAPPEDEISLKGWCVAVSDMGEPLVWKSSEPFHVRKGSNSLEAVLSSLRARVDVRVDTRQLGGCTVRVDDLTLGGLPLSCVPFGDGGVSEACESVHPGSDELLLLSDGGWVSFLVPENVQGVLLPRNTDPLQKTYDNIPEEVRDRCSYVELSCSVVNPSGQTLATGLVYRFYIGEDNCKDFSVRRNRVYMCELAISGEGEWTGRWSVNASEPGKSRSISLSSDLVEIEGAGMATLSVYTKPSDMDFVFSSDDALRLKAGVSYMIDGRDIIFTANGSAKEVVEVPVKVTSYDGSVSAEAVLKVSPSKGISLSPVKDTLSFGATGLFTVSTDPGVLWDWKVYSDREDLFEFSREGSRVSVKNINETGYDYSVPFAVICESPDTVIDASVFLKTRRSIALSPKEGVLRYGEKLAVEVKASPVEQEWTWTSDGPVSVSRTPQGISICNTNDGEQRVKAHVTVTSEDGSASESLEVDCWNALDMEIVFSARELFWGESLTASTTLEGASFSFRNPDTGEDVSEKTLSSAYGLSAEQESRKITLRYDQNKLQESRNLAVVLHCPDGSEAEGVLKVNRYEERISVSPSSLNLSYKETATLTVSVFPEGEEWKYVMSDGVPMEVSKDSPTTLKITNLNAGSAAVSGFVTCKTQGGLAEQRVNILLQPGHGGTTREWSVPEVNVTCGDIPAGGGSVTEGFDAPYKQLYRDVLMYTDGTSSYGEWQTVEGVVPKSSIVWTGGAEGVPSKGALESGRTTTGKYLGWEVVLNGMRAEGALEVFQAENRVVSEEPSLTAPVATPARVGAAGGTSEISGAEGSLKKLWSSGSEEVRDLPVSLSVASPATISDRVVSIPANPSGLVRSFTVTATAEGVELLSCTITQSDDAVTGYSNPQGLVLTPADIPASGGSVGEAALSGTVTQTAFYASGASVEEVVPLSSLSLQWGPAVSGDYLGTEKTPRTRRGALKLTYTANGKSTVMETAVFQEGNEVVSTGEELTDISVSKSRVSAKGGSVTVSGGEAFLAEKYTSGATKRTAKTPAKTVSPNSSDASVKASLVDKTLTVPSLGKTVVAEGTYTVTYSYGTLSRTALVTQDENIRTGVEDGSFQIGSFSYADLSLQGGSVSPQLNYRYIRKFLWSSGEYDEVVLSTGADTAWTLEDASGVFSIDDAGNVSAVVNESEAAREAKVSVRVSLPSLEPLVAEASVKQLPDEVISTSYEVSDLGLTPYSVPAGGGEVTVSGGDVYATYTWKSGRITRSEAPIGRATFTVGANSLVGRCQATVEGDVVYIPSLGKDETTSESVYVVSASWNGSQVKTCQIRQEANRKTLKSEVTRTLRSVSITGVTPSVIYEDSSSSVVEVSGVKSVDVVSAVWQYSSGTTEGGSVSSDEESVSFDSISAVSSLGSKSGTGNRIDLGRNTTGNDVEWTVTGTYQGKTSNKVSVISKASAASGSGVDTGVGYNAWENMGTIGDN